MIRAKNEMAATYKRMELPNAEVDSLHLFVDG